jgi:AraC-like DNA-binding protein/ligand-binding sensor protein
MEDRIHNEGLLEKTMKWIGGQQHLHISVHTLSEIFSVLPALKLSFPYKIHCSTFCDAAKTTSSGLRCCLKNKYFSIQKAFQVSDHYMGRCYLGLTEIVKPVYWQGEVCCLVYVGNLMLEEDFADAETRIHRVATMTKVKDKTLMDALGSVKVIQNKELPAYIEVAEIVASLIKLCISDGQTDSAKLANSKDFPKRKHWIIEQIIDYVDKYYYNDIILTQMAGLYFVNPQYLSRLFTKEMGIHFTEYVNQVRMEHAKQQLLATDDSIMQISMAIGYNNVTYFNTLFKKYTLLTPQQYRRANRERM